MAGTSLRVNFLLPVQTNLPVGGYKVVYRYANGLAEKGHRARVVLPKSMQARTGVAGEVKTWFPLDPRVEVVFTSDLREKWLPEADFSVATFWQTAPIVNAYSPRMGKKLYLLQHLETFAGPPADVIGTWKLPLQKIVIAKWLEEFAGSLGETCVRIPNGIDFDEFAIDTPIEQRPKRVAMLYHADVVKGVWDGIHALEVVRQKHPDLSVVFFGVPERPWLLPDWIEYIQNASSSQVRQINNSCRIFLHPSWSEGCPAPPAEAMACGAAIVAAANPGVMDYLVDGENAVTAKPTYWLELADKISNLFDNEEKRIQIAKRGSESIREYTWPRAVDAFEKVLLG
jgi:glycosyltransferase involved in cell wall biosynthesis